MFDPVTGMVIGWLGEWATLKVAETLLGGVSSKLNKTDLDKVLKTATRATQDQSKALFYKCQLDFIPKFLEEFFQGTALEQLQKPLKHQGKPDIDFLVIAFKKEKFVFLVDTCSFYIFFRVRSKRCCSARSPFGFSDR